MTRRQTDYVTFADAILIHDVLLRKYGGGEGLRDAGALESALVRPQMGYYADLVEEAAALLESIAVNHPFVDGNKRVAFGVVDVFLRINGHRLTCSSDEAHAKMIGLFESNAFRFEQLEPWLRSVVEQSRPAPD